MWCSLVSGYRARIDRVFHFNLLFLVPLRRGADFEGMCSSGRRGWVIGDCNSTINVSLLYEGAYPKSPRNVR